MTGSGAHNVLPDGDRYAAAGGVVAGPLLRCHTPQPHQLRTEGGQSSGAVSTVRSISTIFY